MKKVLLSIFTITIIGLFSSCNSDDDGILIPVDPIPIETDTILQGQITSDKTLTNDLVWEIEGRVTVTAGFIELEAVLY